MAIDSGDARNSKGLSDSDIIASDVPKGGSRGRATFRATVALGAALGLAAAGVACGNESDGCDADNGTDADVGANSDPVGGGQNDPCDSD